MPDDFILRRSGATGPFLSRKVAGGLDGGPVPDTPEASWLWLKERLQGGNQISLQYDDEERLIVINGADNLNWGSIIGTLSNQTDLQTALDSKAPVTHTHPISQVTNLQSNLDAKAALTQVVRHDVVQSINSTARLRAARNIGALVMLSAELRGPSAPWCGENFSDWLWTLPANFVVWDFSFGTFSSSLEQEWTCDAQIIGPVGIVLWEGQLYFGPDVTVSVASIAGSLSFPAAQPLQLSLMSTPPYNGNLFGLQFHARGIWSS